MSGRGAVPKFAAVVPTVSKKATLNHHTVMNPRLFPRLSLLCLLAASVPAHAASFQISVQNLAPANGIYLTPVWGAFHDGTYDLFNSGSAASMALERLAEDGNLTPLQMDFAANATGGVSGVAGMAPIAPGATVSFIVNLDPLSAATRHFSYASMVIPSNDAFVANGNPTAFPVFDLSGNQLLTSFTVSGSSVWDAGTEVNDEVAANTAFLGQAAPDTGMAQGGLVTLHGGFNAPGTGGILDQAMFSAADFTQGGYQVAQITITPVPEPEEWAAVGAAGLVGFAAWRRRAARRLAAHPERMPRMS
jgi:MYXO-CTERM domain-containing protein